MIVATAGHVDHGKSSLVRALTGADTDRLPEEKARGLSIDLGYAYWDRGDGEIIGFVDVPGHERFIANMLSGVGTMDAALFVVAADEGIMPQTREHLEILDLLGFPGGITALTKIDRAKSDRKAAIESDIRGLVRGTPLAQAPIIRCSAVTGDGISDLSDALRRLERAPRPNDAGFRLAIDRVFTLPGIGLTVTGAVTSGAAGIGDRIVVSPGGPVARIRSIHSQGQSATAAAAGRRCALTLAGPSVDQHRVRRGQWVVEQDGAIETDRIDVLLRPSRQASLPLRKSFHARLHIGTLNVAARVVLLDDGRSTVRAMSLAQVLPDLPLDTVWGDRFVLRDTASRETLAGGMVVTPFGARRGRSKPDRLTFLQSLSLRDPKEAFAALLNDPPMMVDWTAFARVRNLGPASMQAIAGLCNPVEATVPAGTFCVHPRQWQQWQEEVIATLEKAHRETPDRLGLSATELCKGLPCAPPPMDILSVLIDTMRDDGRVAIRAGSVHLANFQPRLRPDDLTLWCELEKALETLAPHAPALHELAKTTGLDVDALRRVLVRAAALKLAVQVSKNRFALPKTIRHWAGSAEVLSRQESDFSASMFKDQAGIGRNLTIDVLEYFDHAGFTQRCGSYRKLLRSADGCFGSFA